MYAAYECNDVLYEPCICLTTTMHNCAEIYGRRQDFFVKMNKMNKINAVHGTRHNFSRTLTKHRRQPHRSKQKGRTHNTDHTDYLTLHRSQQPTTTCSNHRQPRQTNLYAERHQAHLANQVTPYEARTSQTKCTYELVCGSKPTPAGHTQATANKVQPTSLPSRALLPA
jgi:SLT domain-containing protein